MRWTIKLVFEAVPGSPVEHEIGMIERAEEISPAIVGLTIADGKALLAGLQEQIVTAQIQQHVANIKPCPRCGKAFRTKGYYHSTLRSVYGRVDMVTVLTDGDAGLRAVQQQVAPHAVHILDWFHISMRFKNLEQIAKGITAIADGGARAHAVGHNTLSGIERRFHARLR